MPRVKKGKKGLLRRVRRQRLKNITILPSLVTILNGICGFAAIVFASRNEFNIACYVILLGMIADMLDGRLARMSKTTSSFGGQLDSLCDVVSFGAAPAFLMLRVLESELEFESLVFMEDTFFQRFIWLAAAAYLSCAIVRLARFNVENQEDESAHMSFIGLPTPAAAGVIVSLILFYQEYRETFSMLKGIIFALPFIALGVAILMVSRMRYPHVLNQYLRGKKTFTQLIKALLLLVFIAFYIQEAMVVLFCGFAAGSFLKWLYRKFGILHSHTELKNVTHDESLESQSELHRT
jgi:CDP-diacylglycerol--serine O-phosphatidyltransferase